MSKLSLRFYIDRGGTFTDAYIEASSGETRVMKLLSVDPANYPDAPREIIRRGLNEFLDLGLSDPWSNFPASSDDYHIESIRMGTTVATNALLERKGSDFALVTTKGFGDLLEIGYQNRPKIFDLNISKPELLYKQVIEVDERILYEKGSYKVEKAIDISTLGSQLSALLEDGIENLAIVLIHSYAYPEHEKQIRDLAYSLGFKQVSISSEVIPMIKIVARGNTTLVDAYLSPVLNEYIEGFKSGFSDSLKETELLFMKSDGGLIEAEKFNGANSILSGPAGGVVGFSSMGSDLIGFDMGGTSTDVSRFAGDYEISFQSEIDGIAIQSPQLDIKTVAAGGGSLLTIENGMFKVGPESSGAHPGPVCYKKGGKLSVTDANLVLGRLVPEYFPKVFGSNANEALDLEASRQAFKELKEKHKLDMSIEEIAAGFIKVANETMARAIREISVMKGHDIKEHALACFGGAGAQHACAIAADLGIKEVLVHKYSGILSAYGIGLAERVYEAQKPLALDLNSTNLALAESILSKTEQEVLDENHIKSEYKSQRFLNLRYEGTDTAFMLPESKNYAEDLRNIYLREFGFGLEGREIIIDDVRVRITIIDCNSHAQGSRSKAQDLDSQSQALTKVFLNDQWYEVPVYLFEGLDPGFKLDGPAIIIQDTATLVIEADWQAEVNVKGNLILSHLEPGSQCYTNQINTEADLSRRSKAKTDPVQLAIFSNRFMSIAEQMGRTLQRTAISTNIKERCDFSCALFDAEGNLIANAPHQPVHLGAMSEVIKKQKELVDFKPGDVILSNHPSTGGSHLPDMTVISPVFGGSLRPSGAQDDERGDEAIYFFLANRAHHADIGGISPGSMPSFSKTLDEEGVAIKSFKLVSEGNFNETELRKLFSQSRSIEDNVSDLRAQVAANKRGAELITDLVQSHSLELVQAYMQHIQDNAEESVRKLLKHFVIASNDVYAASDYLDDGSEIKLTVTIDAKEGSAIFDFTGTSAQLSTNLNTPKAVVSSAVIYALRAMINKEIPLNQGCLKPIEIIVPHGSLLDPEDGAAVVGGNVLTSQRIVDVIFKAFGTCAASQGCMNNISFGRSEESNLLEKPHMQGLRNDDERSLLDVNELRRSERNTADGASRVDSFGYYETIGGGSGAGPSWHGASAVHTHMTNTRITDPEILETRYPVILREFSIRKNSGGQGKYKGGNGLVRTFEFLDDLSLSILTERREYAPYGLEGGQPGAKGENLICHNGHYEAIAGKAEIKVSKGDKFKVLSPGGGGFG